MEPPHRATPAASFLFMPPDRVLLAAFSLGSSSNSEIYFFISALRSAPDSPFNWENDISKWGHNSVHTEHWRQIKAKVKLFLCMPRRNMEEWRIRSTYSLFQYKKERNGQLHALVPLLISKTILAPTEEKAGWSYSYFGCSGEKKICCCCWKSKNIGSVYQPTAMLL